MDIRNRASKALKLIDDFRIVAGVILVVCAIASIQKYAVDRNSLEVYHIYTTAFHNLMAGKDLYVQQPGLDYFLYTPTFAMLMGPFAALPDAIGSLMWNLLNASALMLGLHLLPLSARQKTAVALIVLVEMLTSLQNFQSNALIAGMLLLAFASLERRHPVLAAFLICFAAYAKIYAIGFAVMGLFYPRKWRFTGGIALGLFMAFLVPLLVVSQDQYEFLCKRWLWSLGLDTSSNLNAMGILRAWFGLDLGNTPVQAVSLAVLAIPLLRLALHKDTACRLHYFCSLLVWVVVFSHKAESPSYVIAMTGIALWFVTDRPSPFLWAMLALALLLTSLSSSDLFPRSVRSGFFTPYGIKAAPCLLWWLLMELALIAPLFLGHRKTIEAHGGQA